MFSFFPPPCPLCSRLTGDKQQSGMLGSPGRVGWKGTQRGQWPFVTEPLRLTLDTHTAYTLFSMYYTQYTYTHSTYHLQHVGVIHIPYTEHTCHAHASHILFTTQTHTDTHILTQTYTLTHSCTHHIYTQYIIHISTLHTRLMHIYHTHTQFHHSISTTPHTLQSTCPIHVHTMHTYYSCPNPIPGHNTVAGSSSRELTCRETHQISGSEVPPQLRAHVENPGTGLTGAIFPKGCRSTAE